MRITKKSIVLFLISIREKLKKIRIPRRFGGGRSITRFLKVKKGYYSYLSLLLVVGIVTVLGFRALPVTRMQNQYSMLNDQFIEGEKSSESQHNPEGFEDEIPVTVIDENQSMELEKNDSSQNVQPQGEQSSSKPIEPPKPQEPKPVTAVKEVVLPPVTGEVHVAYGMQYNEIFKDWRWHPGVDFHLPEGTPVKASMSGKVANIIDHPYYGWLIVLEHSKDIETRYGHCDQLKVKEGDWVKQGQVIAEVGLSGFTETPHLHWELWIDGETVDPMKYVNKNI